MKLVSSVNTLSWQTRLCLHFFAHEVTMARFLEIERGAPTASDWGKEVKQEGGGAEQNLVLEHTCSSLYLILIHHYMELPVRCCTRRSGWMFLT